MTSKDHLRKLPAGETASAKCVHRDVGWVTRTTGKCFGCGEFVDRDADGKFLGTIDEQSAVAPPESERIAEIAARLNQKTYCGYSEQAQQDIAYLLKLASPVAGVSEMVDELSSYLANKRNARMWGSGTDGPWVAVSTAMLRDVVNLLRAQPCAEIPCGKGGPMSEPKNQEIPPRLQHEWQGTEEANGWLTTTCSCGWVYQHPNFGTSADTFVNHWADHVFYSLIAQLLAALAESSAKDARIAELEKLCAANSKAAEIFEAGMSKAEAKIAEADEQATYYFKMEQETHAKLDAAEARLRAVSEALKENTCPMIGVERSCPGCGEAIGAVHVAKLRAIVEGK